MLMLQKLPQAEEDNVDDVYSGKQEIGLLTLSTISKRGEGIACFSSFTDNRKS